MRLELQGRLAALELVTLESAEPAAASSSSSSAEVHEPQAPVDVSEEFTGEASSGGRNGAGATR